FPLTEGGRHEMSTTTTRIPNIVFAIAFMLTVISSAFPSPARGAWVNATATQFQVGGKLAEIVPTLVSTAPGSANSPTLVNPTCGTKGGPSGATVGGGRLEGVNPAVARVVLVVSCLGSTASVASRLNFISPISVTAPGGIVVPAGTVVK